MENGDPLLLCLLLCASSSSESESAALRSFLAGLADACWKRQVVRKTIYTHEHKWECFETHYDSARHQVRSDSLAADFGGLERGACF